MILPEATDPGFDANSYSKYFDVGPANTEAPFTL